MASRKRKRATKRQSKTVSKGNAPKGNVPKEEAKQEAKQDKGPILITGILFAMALNVLLVTAVDALVAWLALPLTFEALATLVAPVLAGIATAFYVKQRGGIHAFIGGLISIPILAAIVFGGIWQFAILAGAFCGLAGSLTEILLRRRAR